MTDRPSSELRVVYGSAFKKHGANLESTFQADPKIQALRFQRLIANLPLRPGSTLLDVGAGFADLHGYLKDHGHSVAYAGVELIEGMAEEARVRYPNVEIITGDILDIDGEMRFDFVVQSGMFNIPGQTPIDEWREYCQEVVTRMFSLATSGIAFNALTTHTTFRADDLAYFEPSFWEELLTGRVTRHFVVDHGYPLFEYTVTALAPDALAREFNDPAFVKYFPSLQPPE